MSGFVYLQKRRYFRLTDMYPIHTTLMFVTTDMSSHVMQQSPHTLVAELEKCCFCRFLTMELELRITFRHTQKCSLRQHVQTSSRAFSASLFEEKATGA